MDQILIKHLSPGQSFMYENKVYKIVRHKAIGKKGFKFLMFECQDTADPSKIINLLPNTPITFK